MKELNLTVGQKVWSIQFGECNVVDKTDSSYLVSSGGITYSYRHNGNFGQTDYHPSLFKSNPFEPKLLQETVQENKAELINALASVCNVFKSGQTHILASNKLLKLLESL